MYLCLCSALVTTVVVLIMHWVKRNIANEWQIDVINQGFTLIETSICNYRLQQFEITAPDVFFYLAFSKGVHVRLQVPGD